MSPFSSHVPNLQLAWDSTSLSLLNKCARRYKYTMIDNWAAPGLAIHLSFGIAFHSALEQYQKARFRGADHEEALLAAAKQCLAWDDTPFSSHKDYSYKNRHTLSRAVLWHCEQYKDDAFQHLMLPDGSPAVELSFRLNLHFEAPGGEPFLLCGHLDSVGTFQGEAYFMDHKTTKSALDDRYFAGFNPNTQMTNYFAAAQVILNKPAKGGILNAAQLLVNGVRFSRRMITRTPDQMNEWERNLHYWLRQAQHFAEQDYWPMNTNSCDDFGGCPFRSICSKDPSVRETFLKAEFEKRVWNPLDTRVDL